MPEKPELSEARRALLEKYLRGEISPVDTAKSAAQSNGKSSPAANSMPVEENDSLRVPVVPLRSSGS